MRKRDGKARKREGVSRQRGLFVVVEGIDGAGTTTQCKRLASFLRREEKNSREPRKVVLTSEPSKGPVGMIIRLALARRLSGPNADLYDAEHAPPAFTPLDPYTLALLFAADRMDHLANEIRPALEGGHHVICDRYVLSSLAYQGLYVSREWVYDLNRHADRPDITFLLELPADHSNVRMRSSRVARDLFEDKVRLELVQRSYREVIQCSDFDIGLVETVDASGERSRARVARRLQTVVSRLLNRAAHAQEEIDFKVTSPDA